MTDTTREAVERLAALHTQDAEICASVGQRCLVRENTADTLLALLARAEAAEAQVAAAVQAEREACAAVCDDKDATSRSFGSHADAYEIAARLIRARGPSDALADALRQAEAKGMREALDHVSQIADMHEQGSTASRAMWCAWHSIIAAANAKETPDAE